jgi:transcriptional regulator with XRE-family HTH domain
VKRTTNKHVQPVTGPEKAFGIALREIREARDVSQEKLALDCGLDRTHVSLLERGLRSPTVRTLFRLAEVLKITPSELVRRTELLTAKQTAPASTKSRAT